MKQAKKFSNRLMAMLLSAAMIFAPVLQDIPVYAAETGSEASDEAFHEIVTETGTGDADDAKLLGNLTRAFFAASASDFSNVGGWNESIYAEIAGVKAADVTEVSWSGAMTGTLTGDDFTYLVRDKGDSVRIDIPGLKAGIYTLTVKVGGSTLTKSDIEVYAYDRSGFAHFNYTEGVGAYNDDGTLKENAIVLYVTDENKNTVSLSCNGTTVTGIGNILNSVGQDNGKGTTSKGGKPNTNQGIIKKLSKAGTPLVVRFIGCVSETGLYQKGSYDASDAGQIEGLTEYNSLDYGGSVGDNGHMARIQSGKDITLEGIGYDAAIDGWGFHYVAQSSDSDYGKSFEVRNLTFINTPEDAIGMEGAQSSSNLTASVERCWIHHNEFYCPDIINPAEDDKGEGDGSVDFKRGEYFTCSYNYFDSCHKTSLVGANKDSLQYNLTYHHNHWYMCMSRGPLARNANIHMYNNIVDMQTNYAQNARANSFIFSEYNLFYASRNPQNVNGDTDGNGVIKSYHDSIASVIDMANPATVVQNKTDYVENNCQFAAKGIKYDKFDTDASLSYIPGNNYKLDTDFTELRKVIASQTGVQVQNPKQPEEVAAGDYSVVPKDVTVNTIDSLPQNLTPGKVSQKPYVFTVNKAFDVEIAYGSVNAPGVLVNEAGENLLTGDGSLEDLPAGTYMIQANNFTPGDPKAGTTVSFKEITISTLNIERSSVHYHEWALDSSKSVAATCTEAGKDVYICEAEKDGGKCDETKEETVAALGHSWSEWTVDKPATETEAGQKSRSCTRNCGATERAVIPAGSGSGEDSGVLYNMYLTSSDIPTGTYTSDFQKNGFTVKAGEGADQSVSVDVGSKKTIGGKDYTGRLKTGGIGTKDYRSIKFTTKDAATLTMACVVATTGDICTLGVATLNENGEFVEITEGITVDGKTASVITLSGSAGNLVTVNLPAADTYYIYSKGGSEGKSGGVNFYAINVTYAGGVDPVFCTVTFNSMGGLSVESQKVQAGDACVEPAGTLKSGYTFDGWYTDYECTQKYDFSTPIKSDITLYAKWLAGEPAGEYLVLDMKDLPARDYSESFSRNGFTFKATSAKNLSVDASAVTVGDVDYTKRLKLNGTGSSSDRNISFTIEANATLTLVAASGSSGNARALKVTNGTTTYDIANIDAAAKYTQELAAGTWQIYAAKDGVNIYYISVKGEGVKAQYVITIDRQDGTEAVVKTVEEGTQLTETDLPSALTRDGYTFQGWVDEDGSAITVPYTPTQNMTIKAVWQKNNEDPNPGPGTGDGEDPKPGPGTGDGEDPKPGPGTGDGEDPKPNPGTGDGEDHMGLQVKLAVPDEIYVYTGSAIKPAIIVTNNGRELVEGTDYTVKYSNNIKACEWGKSEVTPKNAPRITVTGKGNFTGSAFTNFRIVRKDIGETDTAGGTDSVKTGAVTVAKGSKATPILVYNGVKLGTKDYKYVNPEMKNKKFGDKTKEEPETFEIDLEGTGNYTGSRKVTVKAVQKDALKSFTVTVGKVDLTYNGTSQLLPADAIIVKDKKTKEILKNSSDHTYYEIVYGGDTTSAGTVKFSVVGVGDYTGSVSKTYKIKPLKDNSKFYVDKSGIKESYDYNSAGVTLGEDLKVYYGSNAKGTKLREGTDYKVTYSNNKKVGTDAKYIITFLGNFKGSKLTGTFQIGAASLKKSGAKVEAADKVFKKAGIYKSVPYVTIDGVALKASDYKVEYYIVDGANKILMGGKNKVTAAGTTIEVKVTGKGSYKTGDADCVTGTYTVCDKGSKRDLAEAKVTFYEKNSDGKKGRPVTKFDYTGREVEPAIVEVTIKGQTEPLKQGKDYTVCYVNNKNKGKATVIVKAATDSTKYVGSKTAAFNITARNLKNQAGLLDNLFKMFGK